MLTTCDITIINKYCITYTSMILQCIIIIIIIILMTVAGRLKYKGYNEK